MFNVWGLDAVELLNRYYTTEVQQADGLAELLRRGDSEGVAYLLIMCDDEGDLGDPDDAGRTTAVENHYKWVEAASYLGCHSIRVNAASSGEYEEQVKLAADGLRRLTEFAAPFGLNVIVENHGGLSSNGAWLAKVMRTVALSTCGTLPDFGNFNIGGGKTYDRYQGVEELMPFAKAVSAKSNSFDNFGRETRTDYGRMLRIVRKAGYRGYVGIEWEGGKPGEIDGIRLTKSLLERVRHQMQHDR